MGVIPQGVENLTATIAGYIYLILWILFIIKIFQAIFGGFDFGGGSGGDSDGATKEPKQKKEREQKIRDKEAERIAEDKFNPYNTTEIKFRVVDETGLPLSGAEVVVEPAYAPKKRWFKRNKHTYRKYVCNTDGNGLAPPGNATKTIGTGTVHITVTGYKLSTKNTYDFEQFEVIKKAEPQLIVITVVKNIKDTDYGFEPKVDDVHIDEKKKELVLKGHIE